MSTEKIQATILEVLKEVQRLRGRTWTALGPTSNPFSELEEFDSLCSVEATVLLEERLGCGSLDRDSLFISDDGKQALSILETVQLIEKLTKQKGNKR